MFAASGDGLINHLICCKITDSDWIDYYESVCSTAYFTYLLIYLFNHIRISVISHAYHRYRADPLGVET